MIKYEYFEVKKPVKNTLPFKAGTFIKGYKLSTGYVLGNYNIGEAKKNELLKAGAIKRISKTELFRILVARNVS